MSNTTQAIFNGLPTGLTHVEYRLLNTSLTPMFSWTNISVVEGQSQAYLADIPQPTPDITSAYIQSRAIGDTATESYPEKISWTYVVTVSAPVSVDEIPSASGWPIIGLSLSQAPSVESLTDPTVFSVTKSGLAEYRGKFPVAGSWSLLSAPFPNSGSGTSSCVFIPTENILPNYRYTIQVSQSAISTTGQYLPRPVFWSFLSALSPFYCDPYQVRQRLGQFSAKVSDEDLFYAIWQSSVACNRETMWLFPNLFIGGPTAQTILSWNTTRTYAMDKFVEVDATLRLVRKLLVTYLEESGRKQMGLDFSDETDDQIGSLQKTIQLLQQEREPYRAEISVKRPRPKSTRMSSHWDRDHAPRDWSVPKRGRF